jgi:hypothetical protein
VTRDVTLRVGVDWYDADGAVLSTSFCSDVTSYTGTSWAEAPLGQVVAPASALSAIFRIVRNAGGAGSAYVTNVQLVRQRTGERLLAPNTVTRPVMNSGATVDRLPQSGVIWSGAGRFGDPGVLGTNATGPLAFDGTLSCEVRIDARAPSYPGTALQMVLEVRRKAGTVWGSWRTLDTINVDTTDWQRYDARGQVISGFADTEFRVRVTTNTYLATAVLQDLEFQPRRFGFI